VTRTFTTSLLIVILTLGSGGVAMGAEPAPMAVQPTASVAQTQPPKAPVSNIAATPISPLPPCPSDAKILWHKCQGTRTLEGPQGVYAGEWQNNMMNGQGTQTFSSGTKYVGEFKDDKRNGQGTLTYTSGTKYVGEFKDGKVNGQGMITNTNGTKYVGEFKNGYRNGQGTSVEGDKTFVGVKFANGTKWVGEVIDNNTKLVRPFATLTHPSSAESAALAAKDAAPTSPKPMPAKAQLDRFKKQCTGYGYKAGTLAQSECVMKLDLAERQRLDAEMQRAEAKQRQQEADLNEMYQLYKKIEANEEANFRRELEKGVNENIKLQKEFEADLRKLDRELDEQERRREQAKRDEAILQMLRQRPASGPGHMTCKPSAFGDRLDCSPGY
jgi:hypothetical protein